MILRSPSGRGARRALIRAVIVVGLPVVVAFGPTGCRSAQPTMPEAGHPGAAPIAPVVSMRAGHFMGTPLSGPTTRPAPAVSPATSYDVRVAVVALGQLPAGGVPLGGRARLIVATRGGSGPDRSPVLPSPSLTARARFFQTTGPADLPGVGAVGPSAPVAAWRGALPAGATALFEVADAAVVPDPVTGRPWRRRVEIDVYRPGPSEVPTDSTDSAATRPTTAPAGGTPGGLQIALIVEDLAQPAAPSADSTAAEMAASFAAPVPQREAAVIDLNATPPPGGTLGVVLAVPITFPGSNAAALAAVVDIAPGSADPAYLAAADRCAKDLAAAAMAAGAVTGGPRAAGAGGWMGLSAALEALGRPEARRSALVFLAAQTGATTCEDVALSADAATLDVLAVAVSRDLPATTADATADATGAGAPAPAADALGWALDRAALRLCGEWQAAGTLPPELAGVLVQHAGEAGRHPASVEQLAKATGRADFEARAEAENLIYLEDNSPAARVRAFDWLQSRGRGPAGYDPLGPVRARRAALDKAAVDRAAGPNPATAPSRPPVPAPVSPPVPAPATPTAGG